MKPRGAVAWKAGQPLDIATVVLDAPRPFQPFARRT